MGTRFGYKMFQCSQRYIGVPESGVSILEGEKRSPSEEIAQQNPQTQMPTIAIAVRLTHQRLGTIVFAFHKAIGKAVSGQKLEKREDFLAPMGKHGERLAQGSRPQILDHGDPVIEEGGGCGGRSTGVPGSQPFRRAATPLPSPVGAPQCALAPVAVRE